MSPDILYRKGKRPLHFLIRLFGIKAFIESVICSAPCHCLLKKHRGEQSSRKLEQFWSSALRLWKAKLFPITSNSSYPLHETIDVQWSMRCIKMLLQYSKLLQVFLSWGCLEWTHTSIWIGVDSAFALKLDCAIMSLVYQDVTIMCTLLYAR